MIDPCFRRFWLNAIAMWTPFAVRGARRRALPLSSNPRFISTVSFLCGLRTLYKGGGGHCRGAE